MWQRFHDYRHYVTLDGFRSLVILLKALKYTSIDICRNYLKLLDRKPSILLNLSMDNTLSFRESIIP
jgi:hypothetical protein